MLVTDGTRAMGEEGTMKPHVSAITLGVEDLDRAERFYADGLRWPIEQEQGAGISFAINGGSAAFALLPRDALAGDAGMSPDGEGFRGLMFSYVVGSEKRVDEVLAQAERAGGTIVRPAQREPWGTYGGYFADPDGNLWKVAAAPEGHPLAAEQPSRRPPGTIRPRPRSWVAEMRSSGVRPRSPRGPSCSPQGP
jgi:predicted enzyme related to lactoylglutathione lyase